MGSRRWAVAEAYLEGFLVIEYDLLRRLSFRALVHFADCGYLSSSRQTNQTRGDRFCEG